MPALVIALCALVLAAAFGWAACAKALYWASWHNALTSYALPEPLLPSVAIGIPALELLLLALMLGGRVLVGAALTLLLLGGFSMAVLRAMVLHRSTRLPCGCFGRTKARDYRALLVRNGFLGALAAVVLIGGREVDPAHVLGASSGPPVPAALGGAAAVALFLHWGRRATLTVRKRAESSVS